MKVEFFRQSARDADNIAGNPSRLLNLYPEPLVPGGRSQYVLKSVLGLNQISELPGLFVRAMGEVDGKFYTVGAGRLYEINATAGSFTDRGAIDGDPDTTISGNNGVVTVVAGGKYYTWDGATLTEPAAGAFSDFGAVDYFGNYTILTELGGRRWQWSDIADATDLPGLNFSTADGRDDNLIRPFRINGVLYLFKETSHEVWYLTGAAGANAFERQAGGVIDVGLKAFGLICRFPGGAFCVGSDNKAYIMSGQLQPVSTPAVETAIQTGEPLNCIAYEDEGHTFCNIVFRDRPAWVYDVSAGEWHERAEGLDNAKWTVTASVKHDGAWYAGKDNGTVSRFERINRDGSVPLIREATSRALIGDGERFTIHELEIYPRTGFDNASVTLALSRDGGLTWGAEKVKTWGIGEYAGRMNWRALGQFRQATARIRMSGTTDVPLLAEGRVRT
jgi:hypothetical protein